MGGCLWDVVRKYMPKRFLREAIQMAPNAGFLYLFQFPFMPLYLCMSNVFVSTTIIIKIIILKISYHIYDFILFHLSPLQFFYGVSHSVIRRICKVGVAFLEMVL